MQQCVFFKDLDGLTEVFDRMSAGMSILLFSGLLVSVDNQDFCTFSFLFPPRHLFAMSCASHIAQGCSCRPNHICISSANRAQCLDEHRDAVGKQSTETTTAPQVAEAPTSKTHPKTNYHSMILTPQSKQQKMGFLQRGMPFLPETLSYSKKPFPADKCGFQGHVAGNCRRVSGLKSRAR